MMTFLAIGLCAANGFAPLSQAGEARLKNGMLLHGRPVPIEGLTKRLILQTQGPIRAYPILMIHTGMIRYFVPARQVKSIDPKADLSRYVTFKLPQRKIGRKRMVSSLGGYTAVTPFDRYGRRRITLSTARGPLNIIEGVTVIRPTYLTVRGLSHVWEHGIATTAVPPKQLDAMIRTATDQQNPDDRMAIARLYLQAGLYRAAATELAAIGRDFPELKDKAGELSAELRQLRAQELLRQMRMLKAAGQHHLVYAATQRFPTKNMSAAVLRNVQELAGEYIAARKRIRETVTLLGDLQANLKQTSLIDKVAPLRSEVADQLDMETLGRLEAFWKFKNDPTLSASEKLALAYSGWLLGAGHAITDLPAALRSWNARFLVLRYLRSENPQTRTDILGQLNKIEGADTRRIAMMIPFLPPVIETPDAQPGQPNEIEVDGDTIETDTGTQTTRYSVLLPREYSPHHRYPLIVALHPAGVTAERELAWWGGTRRKPGLAQGRGYIVIAPKYLPEKETAYNAKVSAHRTVLHSIRDARKRFNIDSDRVFLTGHGIGGDAAFDIGMSHPDLFAGVMPITGLSKNFCKWYWRNARRTAWYVVGGELDRDSVERNARDLNRMMRSGFDIIDAEYIGRGHESYHAETGRLFDWMELPSHRRAKFPTQIDARILRPSDNRFYWLQGSEMPRNVSPTSVIVHGGRTRVSPMTFKARVTKGNTIYVTSGARQHTLWLSPAFVDFDKRVVVRHRGRQVFNGFPRPDMAVLLEDLRVRGDRQKLYPARIDLN